MGGGLTVLSPVQKGPIWRVRIPWPNGLVHYFGKFTSEKDASDWITSHPWLAERQAAPGPADFRAPRRYRRGQPKARWLDPRARYFDLNSPPRLVLEIDIRQFLPGAVDHDEARLRRLPDY
jgi:hypothetical protein